MPVKVANVNAPKMSEDRQHKNVEFLQTLYGLMESNQSDFAKACGKKASNMNRYLSGQFQPGKKVLASCLKNLFETRFEWSVQPIMEIERVPENLNSLPDTSGLYILYDSAGNVLYVGKATNFRTEVRQTLGRRIPVGLRFGSKLNKERPYLRDVAKRLSLYGVESERVRHNLEVMFLRAIANQTYNSNIGRFK
jgi:hypothetical protein